MKAIRLTLSILAALVPLSGIAAPPARAAARAGPLEWQTPARLRHALGSTRGTFGFDQEGIEFRPDKGPSIHWLFQEIQTFDLLPPRRFTLTSYENRGWRRYGERKYRFELGAAMPPDVAAGLAERVGKPVRNGVPDPAAESFATLPARHRALGGGSNGILRFRTGGIDYVTPTGKGARSWRWADIETLANPDPYHLRVAGYRETFIFQLKQTLARDLFDRLWDQLYARDLKGLTLDERKTEHAR